jgi:hypothetical protein
MQTLYTSEDVAKMTTQELIELYNRLTNKSIKRFSSRVAGEQQVLRAIAGSKASATASAAAQPESTKQPTAAPARPVAVRTVKGKASASGTGRPVLDFKVKLTESSAKSSPHKESLRQQLIEWLKKRDEPVATIDAIERHFNRNMRGVVRKLVEVNWLQRIEDKAAA